MTKQIENLEEKLIEKSKEAFIVAIELYNKPTIKYRVEGFSFFICNAWELMLKAHLIRTKGEYSIYYSTLQLLRDLGSCRSQFTQGLN
ncbi:MAG: DUF3644 domain-containing protein [Megasphaera elsdenii]|nr:DUF3644 domain-containing protein [Megasphaera elsdenii]